MGDSSKACIYKTVMTDKQFFCLSSGYFKKYPDKKKQHTMHISMYVYTYARRYVRTYVCM